MSILGIEITKFSWIGAAGMPIFGIIDYLTVNWALVQGERQALRDGTTSAEKTKAFERVRTVLAVMCFCVSSDRPACRQRGLWIVVLAAGQEV